MCCRATALRHSDFCAASHDVAAEAVPADAPHQDAPLMFMSWPLSYYEAPAP